MQDPSGSRTLETLRTELNDYRNQLLSDPLAFNEQKWNDIVQRFMKEYTQTYPNSIYPPSNVHPSVPVDIKPLTTRMGKADIYQTLGDIQDPLRQYYSWGRIGPVNVVPGGGQIQQITELPELSEAEDALQFLFNQARAFLPNGKKDKYITGGLTKAMKRAAEVLGVDIGDDESEDTD